ncbi:2Fe-2S iron-sulfur cluster-binding protein [Thiolapillus brandeum]|uniref:Oxidoreductase FAD-binding subunit n=1 Tax=Thiolapillus brandeum TaxID=1076588 RepID=A0A7U6JHM8_9GAMM|nr:2Fe-2S iron-sulfur cluster-binding protein [Thiolapillus brandeum]BAO43853.1 oxidoreductase FAD-binding subunit [Thiolapillus brandeum]
MGYKITVDGSDNEFSCDDRDTLLRAALRQGVTIPYECNSGGCGSCKFELVSGEVEDLWPDAPALTPRDKRKGKKLACQCRPVSDAVIKVRLEDHAAPEIRPNRFKVRYLGRRDLTADMAEFRFQSDAPARFLPGQFAMLSLPGIQGDRAYSMSNIPNEAGYWQFIIKRMPEGNASTWLFSELKEGDVLELDAPYGQAYLRPEIERDVVCIAGGSGLSPVMSIVRAATGDSRFADRKIYLFYGGRTPGDICTPELLSEIEPLDAQLICETAISDADAATRESWEGPCCFVHELVEQTLGDRMPEFEYYFCGPAPMTEAVQRMLMIEHKVPFEQIHFDRFF